MDGLLAEAYRGQVWCALSSWVRLYIPDLTAFQESHKHCANSLSHWGSM